MMFSDAVEQTRQGHPDTQSPASVDELEQLVRDGSARGRAVRVLGGGTRQAFGNAGQEGALRVATSRLSRVIDYSPVDLTIAVEPGCTISEINEVLAENGQTLPLDVAHPERATIGGSFATGLSGPRRLKHGSLKDRVIGTEAINSAGMTTKSGGMVVKNVSGYELSRLHYGALGAFGIITRINLKVAPKPEVLAGLVAEYSTPAGALTAGRSVAVSQLEPDAVTVIGAGDAWRLQVWFSGTGRLVQSQIERALVVVSATEGFKSTDTTSLESVRLELFEPFVDLAAGNAIVRVSAPPSGQQTAVESLMRAGSREICADIGSGLVYAIADPVPEWRDAVRRVVQQPVFLALPDHLKRGVDVFGGVQEPGAKVLRRLKREYDPGSIFNPGRFVLGL